MRRGNSRAANPVGFIIRARPATVAIQRIDSRRNYGLTIEVLEAALAREERKAVRSALANAIRKEREELAREEE
jgi:hypothetical protein